MKHKALIHILQKLEIICKFITLDFLGCSLFVVGHAAVEDVESSMKSL